MGILSTSLSLTRYKIVENVPDTLWSEIQDRLLKFSFQDIDNTTDERSFGWVCFDNMLDSRWQTAPPTKGEFLAFALRLDTRRIPPAVLKKHFQIHLDEFRKKLKEQGQKYISREQKKELKEQVKLKLLTKTLPVPAFFDVVWDMQKNLVYFASTRPKVLELFEELFTKTFELHLEPQSPFFKALNILGQEQLPKIENLEPTIFV
ncbi:recombination-associated protein RdgC [Desulfohalobiaceae bacterium Ax17]|jgi:DNA recombination-dependent growth factor C|uniref:recombination-associated protein RdgC n=1 Tax=Desulfovulcanus ferrireducens TaxID=2831190 RepID=UPI00207BC5C7|nr:recombination-associated protein RdgC [Desulfovulcanus ferrireducens]MBT8764117.1 recombination-associated protein RdgC [Desulfovulcanus ferrireducens]